MTFPTGTVISTDNVASASSDPSLARSDIYNLITAFNQLVASVNAASGVVTLDGSAKLSTVYLPATQSVTGDTTLQPSTGIVNIRNVLRLRQINVDDLGSFTGTDAPTAGDLCYLTNGDAGNPCLAVYNGSSWKIVRLMTTVGSVGAALTASSTLVGEAD